MDPSSHTDQYSAKTPPSVVIMDQNESSNNGTSGISNGRKLVSSKSLDAHMRQLVPDRVSEDDKLVEYDFLLLDRFLDVLQDLHGEDMKETVKSIHSSISLSTLSIITYPLYPYTLIHINF